MNIHFLQMTLRNGQNKTKADYSHNMQRNHETACSDILGVLEVSVIIKVMGLVHKSKFMNG